MINKLIAKKKHLDSKLKLAIIYINNYLFLVCLTTDQYFLIIYNKQ